MRYRIRTTRLLACTALGVSSVALAAAAAELLPVTPPDEKGVIVGGVSADGSVVVGTLNPWSATSRSGFVWTQPDGMSLIGNATLGGTYTQRFTATGVSNDGGVIVGQASVDMFGETGAWSRGYMWTEAGGFVDLGTLDGHATSNALGVSGDGQAVVGLSYDLYGVARGFRWTQTDGMGDIGEFSAGYPFMAASYDGSVVAGNTASGYLSRASVWTEASGQIENLPLLNGGNQSVARDISDDGSVIVGQAHNGANGGMHAVRWVDTVPQDLTTPGTGLGDNYSYGFGVSGNGAVVVGEVQTDGPGGVMRGFRWAEDSGMQTVEDWLRDSGAVIVTDITYAARATNCDGSVVVGETGPATGENQMFIARGNGTGSADCGGTTGGGDTGTAPANPALLAPTGEHASIMAGAVSADGSKVVGTLSPSSSTAARGFVWTESGGMANIGGVPDGGAGSSNWFTATGISNTGDVIVGSASNDLLGSPLTGKRAYLWSAADGFRDLGSLGTNNSDAWGVSGDGTVVVGSAADAGGQTRAFRWDEGDGMQSLGELDGETSAAARAASYDGAVIVGTSQLCALPQAFRWTADTGMTPLENPEKPDWATVEARSWAVDVSDDGRVIAGNAGVYSYNAVRWVDGALQELGHLPGAYPGYVGASTAYGISGNGLVVVGEADDGDIAGKHGFRWAEDTGMMTVEDWLRDSGATVVGNVTRIARAASCDGSIVVGETRDDRLFVARGNGTGAASCDGTTGGGDTGGGDTGGGDTGGGDTGGGDTGGGDTGGGDTGGGDTGGGDTGGGGGTGGVGVIIVDEFNASLADAGVANVATLGNVNLLLNGAGSRPLDRRAAPGKTIAWIGGDWGRIDGGGDDGRIGIGEIGAGYNFGAVQINAAAGFTRFDQALGLGGRADLSAGYVKVEALSRLYATDNGGLWGALTASGMWGSADFTRNYMNGGVIDSSFGSTDASGYGIRGRLQWENAIRHFSPYADLSYSRGCFDAYSETGGGFPAAFNKLCDTSTELRYGFDATYPLTGAFRLIGTLEGVHRFEDKSANVTGQVTGLYAFDLGGATYQQDWLRAGAGFEADIGASTLSVMGNATTQSDGPNAWIAANWRVTF
ncbi:hypothetical protein [Aquamicrobium sp.]|uniref:hypothetical protein n=1 Tax=Aquamicrobium sp. TaxID=1872579 RepID=UPI00349E7660